MQDTGYNMACCAPFSSFLQSVCQPSIGFDPMIHFRVIIHRLSEKRPVVCHEYFFSDTPELKEQHVPALFSTRWGLIPLLTSVQKSLGSTKVAWRRKRNPSGPVSGDSAQ